MLDLTSAKAPEVDIRHVHYFLVLAKYGSISKAAQALGLAQPSLSEHIARLEARLQTRLAIRGPRGITLTEAGLCLAREGEALVGAARLLTDNIRSIVNELRGRLSVGLPPSMSQLLSIPLAETVRLEMPEVRLHLSEGLSGHILEWIDQEKVDFGFVYSVPPHGQFQADPIMEEEMFLIAAHDNLPVEPGADGICRISIEELAKLPLVMPGAPHSARVSLEKFVQARRVSLDVVAEISSLSQMVEMVNRASAYTVLPHAAVSEAVAAGRLVLVHLSDQTFRRTAYLVRKRGRVVSTVSQHCERMVRQILGELLDRHALHARLLNGSGGEVFAA